MKPSQNNMILNHLQNKGSITQEQAKKLYGVARLASRVNDLKKRGYNIVSVMIEVKNRYGDRVKVAQYSLVV
ncbi:helix-turn-helix domain-containing protein [Neisseria sp. Ec49-e6-T10]|uniref:helix-turn-helix domain-containing protein n=1 Tax=Neisseria sp. Ec49-e6-T10 TaxID=3140744 RepID=UPI003EB747BB